MGEYVLIVMMVVNGQFPALDHVYFSDLFACEKAKRHVQYHPTSTVSAECFETKRDRP